MGQRVALTTRRLSTGVYPGRLVVGLLAALALAAPPLAAEEVKASAADFAALEDGISGALKLAPTLFPRGIEQVDVALYDSASVYLFSRAKYDLPIIDHWREYAIYKTPHYATLGDKPLSRCIGSEGFIRDALQGVDRRRLYFTCSPMTIQTQLQRNRGSVYDTRESYLGTIIHEFAHQYLEQELYQVPALGRLAPYVKGKTTPRDGTDALSEAYAIYCELAASRSLYPDHYRRLRHDFDRPGATDRHSVGFRAAAALLDAEDAAAARRR